MFEDRAVADFEDVVAIGLIAARPRLGERPVADAPGHFRTNPAGDLSTAFPGRDLMIREEAIDLSVVVDCRPMK